jgi:hypothetical protein
MFKVSAQKFQKRLGRRVYITHQFSELHVCSIGVKRELIQANINQEWQFMGYNLNKWTNMEYYTGRIFTNQMLHCRNKYIRHIGKMQRHPPPIDDVHTDWDRKSRTAVEGTMPDR